MPLFLKQNHVLYSLLLYLYNQRSRKKKEVFFLNFPPYILLLLATVLWGGNFVIGRAVSSDISPITLAFLRWCVAFLIFFPIAFKSLKREWRQLLAHWPVVIILALTGVASYNTLIYIALHYTSPINASLMNSSTPIFIYILSFIFLKERLTKFQFIGTAISIVGVTFIISGGSFESIQQFSFNKGDLIAVVAVLGWSIYSLLIKFYAGKLPGQSTFLVTIIVGILMLLPFYINESFQSATSVNWNPTTIGAILYVGIFASIVAFLSWNRGVVQMGASKASLYLNFIPLFASIFTVIFLGESIQLFQIIGGIGVILGVIIANRK